MCPPILIDGTTYGPQYWHFMVPSLRERHTIFQPFVHDPDTDHSEQRDSWVWQKLARPDAESLKYSISPEALLRLPRRIKLNSQANSHILMLPFDIISQILSYVDRESTISFAASCLACFRVTVPYIQQRILVNSGRWSKEPLACLGSYLTTLPASFANDDVAFRSVGMKESQWAKFSPSGPALIFGPDSDLPNPTSCDVVCDARQFYWAAMSQYSGIPDGTWPRAGRVGQRYAHCFPELQQWTFALDAVDRQTTHKSTPSIFVQIQLLRRFLSLERFYGITRKIEVKPKRRLTNLLQNYVKKKKTPDSILWYLRNHDTNDFIRLTWYHEDFPLPVAEEALAHMTQRRLVGILSPRESTYESRDRSMTIERAMAVRAYWPDWWCSAGCITRSKIREQKQSSWAGHRFDVVTRTMHDREYESTYQMNGGLEWTDVTEETMKMVQNFVWDRKKIELAIPALNGPPRYVHVGML